MIIFILATLVVMFIVVIIFYIYQKIVFKRILKDIDKMIKMTKQMLKDLEIKFKVKKRK